MKARTKRPLDDGESAPKPKRGRPKVSLVLTRYPPMKDLGEDDIAVKRNTELLSKELERDKPRKEIVLALARQTYSPRRARILSAPKEITSAALLQEYKELRKPYVVCKHNVLGY